RAQMAPVLFELLGEPFRRGHRSHSSVVVRHGSDGRNVHDVTKQEAKMKFVLLVYQGSTPVPSSDRWQALSEAEQEAIYAEYAELNKTDGLAPGLPLGLPDAARTGAGAQRKDPRQERDVSGRRRGRVLRVRSGQHGVRDSAGCADSRGPIGRRGGDPAGREILVSEHGIVHREADVVTTS